MNHSSSSVPHIKRSQKEAQIFKEISRFFLNIQLDEPDLKELTISRVELSQDKGFCKIFFYTTEGQKAFREKLQILKLYKPSMRKSLGQAIHGRYTPDIKFMFDTKFEKQARLDELLEKIKEH